MRLFEYIKKFIQVITWPVVFIAGQFFIVSIFTLFFNNNLDMKNILEYIKTDEYKVNLNNYLYDNKLIITVIGFIIFIYIFKKVIKKLKITQIKNNTFTYLYLIPIGIIISLITNSIFYAMDVSLKTNILSSYQVSVGMILCIGILGPILEELLFRGIVYNKFLIFLNKNIAIFSTSLCFSLLHNNIYQMIYTFILSYVLIHVYDKHKNIKAPIILHMVCNITSYLMVNVFVYNMFSLIFITYIASLLILFLVFKYQKK